VPLLDRLLRLHGGRLPTEDFFTEVVAHLFESDQELARAWLAGVLEEGEVSEGMTVGVRTQVRHAALNGHGGGRRPDLVLTLESAEGESLHLIYVESKVGAVAGPGQLPEYAEHLAEQLASRRTLVYVTRDYDPKRREDVLTQRSQGRVEFRGVRWHDLYRLIQRRLSAHPVHPASTLLLETAHFMEAHRMAQLDRLSPAATLALTELPAILSFMKEALWDRPASRFKEILGWVNKPADSLSQLRWNRYVIYRADPGAKVSLGFQFGTEGEAYPVLRLLVEGDPRQYGETLRAIAAEPGWKAWALDPGSTWGAAYYELPFRDVLNSTAHLTEVQERLDQLLDRLAEVKERLTWAMSGRAPVPDRDAEA
jgi:hypothetical protein